MKLLVSSYKPLLNKFGVVYLDTKGNKVGEVSWKKFGKGYEIAFHHYPTDIGGDVGASNKKELKQELLNMYESLQMNHGAFLSDLLRRFQESSRQYKQYKP